ncbi:Rieske 2Fe-2S domain-containing protein [Allitabrizicola rongguiensis]|uniref:Rieske 2Fe-2S domain-containing protein n=1 Tax=Alitabrizicola rongguiensis TaxID=2909234 RepID=UPI001F37D6DA|nr:Rieske (2Fe-2S) protein [Tabrizicola rongguiensis]
MALSRDVPPQVVIPTFVDGRELAVWRSQSGRIAAWDDRCPHRGMRLSHGFVRGESLSCIYHGWSYNEAGLCQRIPAHPDLVPPEAIRVPTVAAVESDGIIWVASEPASQPPPTLTGLVALRSLTVEAPATAIATAAGMPIDQDGALRPDLAGIACVLLVQPIPGDRTVLHVLVASNASPAAQAAVSRALEDLRRRVESERLAA